MINTNQSVVIGTFLVYFTIIFMIGFIACRRSSDFSDYYKAVFRRGATHGELALVGRLAVLGVSIAAVLLAMNPESNVLGLMSYAWAGFGAAFAPTLIASLFWSRLNQWGALAGIIAGGLTVAAWAQLSGGIFDVYEIVPGFLLSTLFTGVVTLVTPAPKSSVKRQFTSMLDEGKPARLCGRMKRDGLLPWEACKAAHHINRSMT